MNDKIEVYKLNEPPKLVGFDENVEKTEILEHEYEQYREQDGYILFKTKEELISYLENRVWVAFNSLKYNLNRK